MKKRKPKAIFVPIIGLLIFAIILFVIFYFAESAIKKSDFFKINEIIINGNDGANLSFDYLKGRNIFAIDLKKEEYLAMRLYPISKAIKLIKILPNRIFVDFVIRRPIAYVKLYRNFYVDEEGILFEAPLGVELFELPVISGLEAKIFGPKKGQKYDIKELTTALKIIKIIKNNAALKDLTIKKVDAADLVNMSVFLLLPFPPVNEAVDKKNAPLGALEVKFGQEYINEKIDILGNLCVQGRKDLGNIQYIDLRFKDPVIKFKD